MHDEPSASELLRGVKYFISDMAAPELEGRAAFHARVAVNVLDIVLREMSERSSADAWETAQLQALLSSTETSLPALKAVLCDKIRGGEIDWSTPGVEAYLTEAALRQMAVDQPRYSGYQAARAHESAGPQGD